LQFNGIGDGRIPLHPVIVAQCSHLPTTTKGITGVNITFGTVHITEDFVIGGVGGEVCGHFVVCAFDGG